MSERAMRDHELARQLGTIEVIIPVHPARLDNGMYRRALESVSRQTFLPKSVSVALDDDGDGAAATRQLALDEADADWVAFLDSDDEMMPGHLEALARCAVATGADFVYSWFCIVDEDGCRRPLLDPFPGVFGRPFDPARPVQTTVTTLVRRELAQAVGFVGEGRALPGTGSRAGSTWEGPIGAMAQTLDVLPTPTGHPAGEDWRFTLGCIAAGAKIVHHPEVTWLWHHHGLNTSGQPDRGDAVLPEEES